jgi:hypothetical protein
MFEVVCRLGCTCYRGGPPTTGVLTIRISKLPILPKLVNN